MKKSILGLVAAACLVFTSCDKDSGESIEIEKINGSVESLVVKEAAIEDVVEASDYEVDYFTGSSNSMFALPSADEASLKGAVRDWFGKGRYKDGEGPEVTKEDTEGGFPKTITVDYGEGLELKNGRVISGKIIIAVSDAPRNDGATRDISYENFKIDSIAITGSAKKVFTAATDDAAAKVSITAERTLTFPDDTFVKRTIEKTKTWVAGLDTKFYPADDIKHIEGSILSVSSEGNEYKKEITKALVKTGACRFITQGTVQVTKDGEVISILDYGDGTCDDVATFTKDGETKEIALGKWRRKKNN